MTPTNHQHQLLAKILSSCLKDFDHQISDLHIESTQLAGGENYFGTFSFVKVNHENESLNLVVKISPQDDARRKLIDPKNLFEREAYFYTKFCREVTEYQKQQCGRQIFRVAHCYGALFEGNVEALVFKNLSEFGYKLWNRMKPMDEEHLSLALEEYGRLHASSLAIRHQDPARFHNLTKYLKSSDIFDTILPGLGIKIFDKRYEAIIESFKKEGREDYAQRVYRFRKQICDILFRYADPNDPYSVVLHGDCWCNNMMFKYVGSSTKPSKVCLINFQLIRLGNPLMDVSFFIYSCAPKPALVNIDRYLQTYHNSLANCLSELGINPELVFPFDLLKEQWKKYSKFGLLWSTTFFRLTICEHDDVPDLLGDGVLNEFMKTTNNQDEMNKRIMDVVYHALETNLI